MGRDIVASPNIGQRNRVSAKWRYRQRWRGVSFTEEGGLLVGSAITVGQDGRS